MPYTPPSQQSPAISKTTSPAISRTNSYSEDVLPRSPVSGRPQLPRSMSSASYMSRHRRSPSIQKQHGDSHDAPPTPTEQADMGVQATDFASQHNGTVRQSPPPINNNLMPTGAVISPPDSSENSDGDDSQNRGRILEIRKLQEAVRSIDLRRESSPNRAGGHTGQTTSEPVSQTTSPTSLTPEARKISHSRSSTEGTLIIPRAASSSCLHDSNQTSDDSDDDDEVLTKPSLVRKKSGELVKPALRPSSRRRYSSMPGTPTYSKSVHFNEDVNTTRHFLQVDKPIAVSAGSSPVETYESENEYPFEDGEARREIRLSNFPKDTFERKSKPVRVERIFLSAERDVLVGTIAVQNIDFHKLVAARFTLDYWKTTSEVIAEFNNDPRNDKNDGCDRFNFHINLTDQANIDTKTLLLCVRYCVAGQEYWDNNNDGNYQIDFVKAMRKPSIRFPESQRSGGERLGGRPHNAIPRSRHTHHQPTHTASDPDEDFGARFDALSTYSFGTSGKLTVKDPSTAIKLKPKPQRVTIPAGAETLSRPSNNLGGRYDFGASLSAALSNAQDKLGRSSGLMSPPSVKAQGSYFGSRGQQEPPATEKLANLAGAGGGDRPAIGSDQYRDLVRKFCYVGSSPNTITSTPSAAVTPAATMPVVSATSTASRAGANAA